jgi:hypothetical protein
MTTFIELTISSLNSNKENVGVPICINVANIESFRPSILGGCRINVISNREAYHTKETYEEIKSKMIKHNQES